MLLRQRPGIVRPRSAQNIVIPAQKIIQNLIFPFASVVTGTTVFPADNTIPQITEGDEYMVGTITPTSLTTRLWIEAIFNVSHSVNTASGMGLFQDATANALVAAGIGITAAVTLYSAILKHDMVSGTIAATTFHFRAGGNTGPTMTMNGISSAAFYGGKFESSLRIIEYIP